MVTAMLIAKMIQIITIIIKTLLFSLFLSETENLSNQNEPEESPSQGPLPQRRSQSRLELHQAGLSPGQSIL